MSGFNSLFGGNYSSSSYNQLSYMDSFNPTNSFPFDNISKDNDKEVKTLKQYYRIDLFVEMERICDFEQMILQYGKEYIMDKFYDYFINSNVYNNYDNYNMISEIKVKELLLGEWTDNNDLNFKRFDYFMTTILNFIKQGSFYTRNIKGLKVTYSNPFTNENVIPLKQVYVSKINNISKYDKMNRVNNWLKNDVNNNEIDKNYDCFYHVN